MVASNSTADRPGHQTESPTASPVADLISLGAAAHISPGRPSTNCLWRWCRRGVLARSGERIRLQHARVGGKIFTTAKWVAEFGQRLAEADAAHFDRRSSQDGEAIRRHRGDRRPATSMPDDSAQAAIEQELREAGL